MFMPWSTEFLDRQLNRQFAPGCHLGRLVQDRERMRPRIDQFMAVWQTLPDVMKNDRALINSLRDTNNANVWGAYNEVYSYWLLRRYFAPENIEYKPRVGEQTPDFRVRIDGQWIYCEVLSILEGGQEAEEYHSLNLFLDEISGIQSTYRITLSDVPTPSAQSNFHGLEAEVRRFLAQDPAGLVSGQRYSLEARGASIRFTLFEFGELGGLYAGGIMGFRFGDAYEQTLVRNLQKKARKYNLPLIAIVGVHTTQASLDTLLEALPIFWREGRPADSSSNRVVGILYNQFEVREGQIIAGVHSVRNSAVESRFGEIFSDLPDVLHSPYNGFRGDMPGLVLEP